MHRFLLSLAAGVSLLGVSAAVVGDEEATIKYRQSIMKAVGGHVGALAAIGKGDVPHKAHAQAHADALKSLSMQVKDAFKEETVSESQAKDKIWSDWAGFESAADKLQMAASTVASAAGGSGNMGAALKELFDSCKGCHKEYRAEKK